MRQVRGKNLFFTTDIKEAVRTSEIIFVAVNTPTKEYGFGKGRAAGIILIVSLYERYSSKSSD